MSFITASANSVILGDLYALQQFIYESKIGAERFYFKLEEGSFQRPAYFIKQVASNVTPRTSKFRFIDSQIMVQYFADDYYDAHSVANDLQMLLTGGPLFADVVLPRYDFSVNPPEKCSVSGYDGDYKRVANPVIGARIDPQSVSNGGVMQEENRGWNVPITFNMRHPMPTYQEFPYIENVIWEIITGTPVLPQITEVCVRGLPSVETTVV